MTTFWRRRGQLPPAPAPERTRYAVSEPALANAFALNHLRVIPVGDGPCLSGLPRGTVALCGRELGWDLREVNGDEVAKLAVAPRGNTGGVWLCDVCHAAYQEREE